MSPVGRSEPLLAEMNSLLGDVADIPVHICHQFQLAFKSKLKIVYLISASCVMSMGFSPGFSWCDRILSWLGKGRTHSLAWPVKSMFRLLSVVTLGD